VRSEGKGRRKGREEGSPPPVATPTEALAPMAGDGQVRHPLAESKSRPVNHEIDTNIPNGVPGQTVALLRHDLDDLDLLLLGDGHVRLDERLEEIVLDIVPLRHGCGCGGGSRDGFEGRR